MIYHSAHCDDCLRLKLLVENQNKPARSTYSLKIRTKIKKIYVVRIKVERALIRYIARHFPSIICGT